MSFDNQWFDSCIKCILVETLRIWILCRMGFMGLCCTCKIFLYLIDESRASSKNWSIWFLVKRPERLDLFSEKQTKHVCYISLDVHQAYKLYGSVSIGNVAFLGILAKNLSFSKLTQRD